MRPSSTGRAGLVLIALSLALFACGGARRPVTPPEPGGEAMDAGGEADGASVASDSSASASSASIAAPKDAWRVELTTAGARRVEAWPSLEHEWRAGSPAALVADRELCLPKGRYVFEESSSPTLSLDLTVDGARVLTQRDFPTELSRPIALDGCVKVHVELANRLGFANISFRVGVRSAAPELPPCEETFPKGAWSACLYQGRNQEELIGRATWAKLAVPKDQREHGNGDFDWLSIVARTTVCFPKGAYVFHSTSEETLRVFVGDALVIDARPTRRFPVKESAATSLEGCQPVRVEHAYRFGHSVLELAWATVGSAQDRAWGVERACAFECPEQSRCTNGDTLAPEDHGKHVCVPYGRRSRLGEYCDAQHPCSQAFCVRARCWED